MTFADHSFLLSPHALILSTSLPSSSQRRMQPALGAQTWPPPDIWSPSYTTNRCTTLIRPHPHDPPTFDPASLWAVSPPNLAPSPDQLKHIYPSPPPTDSDPKHTVPLPSLSEDSPSHALGTITSVCSHPSPLTLESESPPAPLTQDPEGPLTSHPSAVPDLPLSPPPSLPMVPHALPEAITPCCTLPQDEDAHDDADVVTDAIDRESQSSSSSSSPDEPPPSDLLTPLSPIWDLPLDDADARPAGTLEVSTLLSRSLVPPLSRLATSSARATEGDRMTLPCGTNPSIRDLDPVESQCGQLRPLVVPSGTLASARFSMFHNYPPSPNFDGLPSSDGFLDPSHLTSSGKLFVDSSSLNLFLPDSSNPHVLPQLTLLAPPLPFRRRISLPQVSPQELATDTQDTLLSHSHAIGTSLPFGATFDMSHRTHFAPFSHTGTKPSVVTSNLFQGANGSTPDPAPPSPLSNLSASSIHRPCVSAIEGFGPGIVSDPKPMDVDDFDSSDYASLDSDNLEQDVAPPSPMRRTLSELHDDDEDFGSDSIPLSPSRRSFADLPEDTAMNEQPTSPQSPLLVGQPLLTLPGAEPDNSLITAETPVSDWSGASPPRGSGLGLFLPIQAASSNQAEEASEAHAIEPDLNFSPEAIARVDSREFEKLKSVRRRTWVSERKAKEDEVYHAKRAEYLAGRLSVAPPVPSKLADFDERGGVSAGADADETEGPPSEPAQLDESDEKTIRTWLLFTEARRAEARRVRKREKERGRELQALLCLKLGEHPDVADCAGGGAKVKPGKTAIVSMPQLVARMIMKRRDTPRPFSPRKHDSSYIDSPLSRFEPTVGKAWHSCLPITDCSQVRAS